MDLGLDAESAGIFSKLTVAAVCGMIVGVERGYRGKAAGIRTNLLICVGSCLFMIVSIKTAAYALANGYGPQDPGRIAAQVVTGIGFLGAGAILRNRGLVLGLTTAASIWCVAAIGLAVGTGLYFLGIYVSIAVVITLELLQAAEKWFKVRRFRYVRLDVAFAGKHGISKLREKLHEFPVRCMEEHSAKVFGELHYTAVLYFKGNLEARLEPALREMKNVQSVSLTEQGVDQS